MTRRARTRVAKADEGRRLLAWLSSRFTYLSAEEWEGAIREGRVRVDGSESEASRPLRAGETVSFDPGDLGEPEIDARYEILEADADFIVLAKPPFLPCHPGGRFFDNSLTRLLAREYGWTHIATRLDRETSGIVLACRTREAAAHVQRETEAGRVRKSYFALVRGCFPPAARAEGFLSRDAASRVRKKRRFDERPGEPPCERCATDFTLIRLGTLGRGAPGGATPGRGEILRLSLVVCQPETGRSHQIRATLLALGFPILGDKLYGIDEGAFIRFCDGRLTAEDEERLVLPFQALHCGALRFTDLRGSSRSYELPLPSTWPPLS